MVIEGYTVTTDVQIHDGTDSYVDHTEKPLVLFLELFLIKDLYRQNAFLGCSPIAVNIPQIIVLPGIRTCQNSRSSTGSASS